MTRFCHHAQFPHTIAKRFLFAIVFLLAAALPSFVSAQVKRVVIVKCDGLPYYLVDRYARERDPRTGKSQLPWIDHIFYKQGARVENFYVRGTSLSAPSWSLLETGQHMQLKGNVEFDRYTLHAYDYLSFFGLYLQGAKGARVDMPAVEVLDGLGMPLLIDAYNHDERYLTLSLFLRGPRYVTLQKSLEHNFKRSPKTLFDEWTMGMGIRHVITDQLLREITAKLNNPQIKYLDLTLQEFDHVAHHNNDREAHLSVLKHIDGILGQLWAAIQASPLAEETAMVVVSDHGFNTDEEVYSQGYNLVKLLGSSVGGGHHVITKRRLLLDYALKGVNPFVQLITTTTKDSYYLDKQGTDYPTAMLDFDGNERAAIHLRDSDLNLLHILLQELKQKNLSSDLRRALTAAFFQTLDSCRDRWQSQLDELNDELGALQRIIEKQRELWKIQPKKFSQEEMAVGRDKEVRRIYAQLLRWEADYKKYSDFLSVFDKLVSLQPHSFNPQKLKIEDVIPRRSMGERNNIYQLQNYIAGVTPGGFVLTPDGSLDFQKSLILIDYFALLNKITMRNNVQPRVSNRPVDMVVTRIPADLVLPILGESRINKDVVWIYGGPDKQALILAKEDEHGRLSFRYQPVRNLKQKADGGVTFDLATWQPDLPLRILEDRRFSLAAAPEDQRLAWLSEWHTDLEWLQALHNTQYSNALIGLYEVLAQHPYETLLLDEPGLTSDERLMRRFTKRKRELIETDLLVVANNHWNFDVRGFNPGGNHGSFFRISTQSILMFAGGDNTGIPRGALIEEPYDSLSFVPTILALTGKLRDDRNPIPVLYEKGFRRFPGRVINELISPAPEKPKIAVGGASIPR